jgi:peptidoglycan/xylan/chitin deacetylase (PgdA/CDA1 family)
MPSGGEVEPRPSPLETGVFTLSLDFELIWGTLDLYGPEGFRRQCEVERAVVVDRLLALLEEFEISATWCVVGHLFLERCAARNGSKHPEIVRPAHRWSPGDWFAHDPASDEATDPLFYGRSLVEKIRACPVPQEIGSHSFSHVIFGDGGCSREAAETDLAACVAAAGELGLTLRSFAFPRNRVGHLDVLEQHGFRSYRGPAPRWYEQEHTSPALARLGHLWEVLVAAEPPVVLPQHTTPGLCNVAASMIYFPMHGLRRYLPIALRVRRAEKGLAAAARQRRIFHLWMHPTNLADPVEPMFSGLRAVFERVRGLRQEGRIAVRTLGSFTCPGGPLSRWPPERRRL